MEVDVRVPMHVRNVGRGRVAHANRDQAGCGQAERGQASGRGSRALLLRRTRLSPPPASVDLRHDTKPSLLSGTGMTCGIKALARR